MGAVRLTGSNFNAEVIQSDKPVLVEFWAEWCSSCRMLEETIIEAAAAYEGKVKVGIVDIDKDLNLAKRYGVMSFPTLLLFSQGVPEEKSTGVATKSHIANLLDKYV